MKKKSGHRRCTKVVRKSRKNLRRTIKRKRLGKGRRRPTRRYSRIQRGGMTDDDSKCLITVANMLEEGKIKLNSQDIILQLYQKAVNDKYPPACFAYGKYLEKTKGFDGAIFNYEIASEGGIVDAQFRLGNMYENGLGVVKNYAKAMEYYQLAADQKNVDAQFRLGNMYENGLGVVKNYAKAMEYYRLAADQKNVDAQFKLGNMYDFGRGVARDDVEAMRYYELAAAQKHEGAISRLTDMKK
jgi:tetratricopeptide (TPR) repeat protein